MQTKIVAMRTPPGQSSSGLIIPAEWIHLTRPMKQRPAEVQTAANRIVDTLPHPNERKPLKNCWIIDEKQTPDADDAFRILRTNPLTIQIAVADTTMIPAQSPVFLDALRRSETAYQTIRRGQGRGRLTRTPMLPLQLEEKLALTDQKPNLVMVMTVTLNDQYGISDIQLNKGVLTKVRKFTYGELNARFISNGKKEQLKGEVMRMRKVAYALRLKREKGFDTTFKDRLNKALPNLNKGDSRLIVQEFMTLAHQALTQWVYHQGTPILYRQPESVDTTNGNSTYAAGIIKDPSKAIVRGTSALRRVEDLIVWMQINATLRSQPLPLTLDELKQIAEYLNVINNPSYQSSLNRFNNSGRFGVR